MLEELISHLSLYDVIAIVSIAYAVYYHKSKNNLLNLYDRAYVTVAPTDRFYTVLYNKFRDNIFSDNKWRFSPFITVESVFPEKPNIPIGPLGLAPKTDKFEVYKPGQEQTKAGVENIRDDIWRTEDDADMDDKLFDDPEFAKQHFHDRSARMMNRRTGFNKMRWTAEEKPLYFKVYFTIPWFAKYQMQRFVRQLTELKLTKQQKEDLLEKLYWREEERKLGWA